MFVNGSGRNDQSQQRTFHRCFLPSFGSFGQTVSEERNLKNQPIRNKNGLWWPCLLMDRDGLNNCYRGPSIDASYQVSVHLAKRFQRRRVYKISQSETSCLWWSCLLTDRDEINTLYRGPPIDASYQVSVHLAKWFQRRFFFIGQSEIWITYAGHVSERIGTKWAFVIEDLPRMLPTKFRFIWQSSFRGKDFLEINQSETRIVCGGHVCKRIGTKLAILIEDMI